MHGQQECLIIRMSLCSSSFLIPSYRETRIYAFVGFNISFLITSVTMFPVSTCKECFCTIRLIINLDSSVLTVIKAVYGNHTSQFSLLSYQHIRLNPLSGCVIIKWSVSWSRPQQKRKKRKKKKAIRKACGVLRREMQSNIRIQMLFLIY